MNPPMTKYHKTVRRVIAESLSNTVPLHDMSAATRESIATCLTHDLADRGLLNPPPKKTKKFEVRDYGDLTPCEIARSMSGPRKRALLRVHGNFMPAPANAIGMIEQGWMNIPTLTPQGQEIVNAIIHMDNSDAGRKNNDPVSSD